jgi:hypothetical protein
MRTELRQGSDRLGTSIEEPMTLIGFTILFAGGLFASMLVMLEVGRRIGIRRFARDREGARAGIGAVEGALYALLGLLIAFTFSSAASRFDTRRALVVEEANDIGTAWLRLDLLPPDAQPALRDLFRRYVDSRLETYRRMPDVAAAEAELAKTVAMQGDIWNRATAAIGPSPGPAGALLLDSLNTMFDIVTTRTMAARMHLPAIIFGMLAVLALLASLFAGYAMGEGKSRSLLHVLGFAAVMAMTVYVILDLEYPRIGLIRLDEYDRALVDVRQGMK